MRFRVIVPANSKSKIVTFNVKLSSGFRQYSMPLKIDVRTFKLRKEPLPVSGGEDNSGRALFALLLLTGALFLRVSRKMREEGSRR